MSQTPPPDRDPGVAATYRRLLGYSARFRGIAFVATIGMVFDAACGAMFTYLIKPMLRLFQDKDPQMIFWMPIIIIGLFVVRGIATFAADYGMARIARGVVQTLRDEVFRKYLHLPSAYFNSEANGSMISRMTFTVEQVANASTDALKILVLDGLMVVGQVCVMLWQSAMLTLALFLLAPLIAGVVYAVGRRYRMISQRIQTSVGAVSGMVDEVVSGQREVKVYAGQGYEQRRFAVVNDAIRRLNLKVSATNAISTSLVQLVAAIALALIVFLATRPAMLAKIDSATFMSVISAMLVMLPSLKRLTTVQANMQRGVVAARDLFAVIDTPEESSGGREVMSRSRGEVEFCDVAFSYPASTAPALNSINLHCPAGSVTALVGRSGSGKSSLVGLLPRFYDPQAGRVLLDGKPISDYQLANLREQIALVSQQIVLFNGSVARNIAYGALENASDADVRAAAEAANAMEFIRRLPDGIHSSVGDAGALLSGGQRQRIAIARAILKDAPILILDEATSALDTESERLIQQALQRLMKQRTVLVIAHRLSTIEHADQIAVLDEGRLVELGTHSQLLALDGHYAALHRLQFREPDALTAPA